MEGTQQYSSLRDKIAAEKRERLERYAEFASLYERAYAAGQAAGEAAIPQPMVVASVNGGDVDHAWFVGEGACGFAWVTITPGGCSFARWLVKNKRGSKAYGGGVQIWISAHGQSVARKEAHAQAMAGVLAQAGIRAYSDSRLD